MRRSFGSTAFMVSTALLTGAVLSGCASKSSSSSTTAVTRPRSSTTTSMTESATTAAIPSAANDLAAYFAAASNYDRQLQAAAAVVNGGIGTNQVTITTEMVDAVNAADPSAAAHEIPPGLAQDVMQPVLTVQSNLVSRFWAFRGITEAHPQPGQPETISPSHEGMNGDSYDYVLTCLANGTHPARSFAADLAAARSAALRAPPVVTLDPSSRSAANLAVWLEEIGKRNSGCMSCGGTRVTSLTPITWHQIDQRPEGGDLFDGDIGGIPFVAHYAAGSGWVVQINAC
jgi:hypothetical protein